jgi:DNA polymerase-1
MRLPELLAALRKRKVELALVRNGDGTDHLTANPAGRLTDDLRAGIRLYKPELMEQLPRYPDPVPYVYVTDQGRLRQAVEALEAAKGKIVAVDTETAGSGLDPRRDRIRLLALAPTATGPVYLVDCFAVDPAPLWPALEPRTLVFHNALFDLRFLYHAGFVPTGGVKDTLLMSRLLTAGTNDVNTLKECAARHLRLYVPKEQQQSNWNAPRLSPEQLAYASLDVAVTRRLYRALRPLIAEAGLDATLALEHRALPALRWLADAGALIDLEAWERLARKAAKRAERARAALDVEAPSKPDGTAWNWNSHQQVRQALALAGVEAEDTAEETLAGIDHALAQAVVADRRAAKFASTYGMGWFHGALDRGRVYGDWHQTGARTGRMSCKNPNLQNIPKRRKEAAPLRKCFVAPPGRVLVRADFSQIELRIAAKVSGDKRMTEALVRGDDLHTLTAQRLTGRQEVTKEERDLSKPVNFGLIYGLGVKGLIGKAREYGAELTPEKAREYRDAFFQAWPGIAAWHLRLKRLLCRQRIRLDPREVRTLGGRRILIDPLKLRETTLANYIVQGAAGDGMKEALALLWERRAAAPPGTLLVLAVHDEIVLEVDARHVEAAAAGLTTAMRDAMKPLLDPIPVEVEATAGPSWGEQVPVEEWLTGNKRTATSMSRPAGRKAPPVPAYRLGNPRTTLYQGDCLEVLAGLPAASVDAVVTDPPYGQTNEDYDRGVDPAVWRECYRLCGPDAALVSFTGSPTYHKIASDIEAAGWKIRQMWAWVYRDGFVLSAYPKEGFDRLAAAMDPIVFATKGKVLLPLEREGDNEWDVGHRKDAPNYSKRTSNGGRSAARGHWPRSVVASDGVDGFQYFIFSRTTAGRLEARSGHPNQKPLSLMAWLVSKLPGRVVLDPFCGSGTTLQAARRLSRRSVGVELNGEYLKMAWQRLTEAGRTEEAKVG